MVYVFANGYMYPEKPGVTGKFKKFGRCDGQDPVVAQTLLRHHRQPDHVFRERQGYE
jgi:hypothetical protein